VTPIEIRLREIRTARGLSQQKLANKAGIPQSTVSRIETGKTSAIDFALVEKSPLKVRLTALTGRSHSRPQSDRHPATFAL
jgi:transcriptional regulator with XRE-family HTH domain